MMTIRDMLRPRIEATAGSSVLSWRSFVKVAVNEGEQNYE